MTNESTKKGGIFSIAKRGAAATGRGWLWATGLRGLGRSVRDLAQHATLVAGAVRQRLAHPEHRRETFEEAVARFQLTDDDLLERAKAINLNMLAWYLCACLALGWGIILSFDPSTPLRGVLGCFAFLALSACKSVAYRFRWCQIRDRNLYSFLHWYEAEGRIVVPFAAGGSMLLVSVWLFVHTHLFHS